MIDTKKAKESLSRWRRASNLLELKIMIDEYMEYYNCTRKQRDINVSCPKYHL